MILRRLGFCAFAWCFVLLSGSLKAQVGIDVSLERKEYLLYEPLDIKVSVTNNLGEPMDLARLSGATPWLDFYVTTIDDEEVSRTDKVWNPVHAKLQPGDTQRVTVNLLPYFLIRETGQYVVTAQITLMGKTVSSRRLKFTIVSGSLVWDKYFTAPPEPSDPEKKLRPRHYSILILHMEDKELLYARIENPEAERVYCTTPLGSTVNFGEPKARIDLSGNLHIFHQSGSRVFNYTAISPKGKRIGARYFSNMSSPPTMFVDDKDNVNIVGGEEIFEDKNKKMTNIPTAPMARPTE